MGLVCQLDQPHEPAHHQSRTWVKRSVDGQGQSYPAHGHADGVGVRDEVRSYLGAEELSSTLGQPVCVEEGHWKVVMESPALKVSKEHVEVTLKAMIQ